RAVLVLRLEQALEEDRDDLAVADHAARVLDPAHLGRVEQRADDDRLAGEAARLHDEGRVRALARARRAAEQDQLLGEVQARAPVLLLEPRPDRVEDELRVLDLEVLVAGGRRRVGGDGGVVRQRIRVEWREVWHGKGSWAKRGLAAAGRAAAERGGASARCRAG